MSELNGHTNISTSFDEPDMQQPTQRAAPEPPPVQEQAPVAKPEEVSSVPPPEEHKYTPQIEVKKEYVPTGKTNLETSTPVGTGLGDMGSTSIREAYEGSELAKRTGYTAPKDDGFWGEAGKGIVIGYHQMHKAFASINAFGMTDQQAEQDDIFLNMNRQLGTPTDETLRGYLGRQLGVMTPTVLPGIAMTALATAAAASGEGAFATPALWSVAKDLFMLSPMFVQSYSEAKESIRNDTRGMMSEDEIGSLALLQASKSTLLMAGGLNKVASQTAAGVFGAFGKRIVNTAFEAAEGTISKTEANLIMRSMSTGRFLGHSALSAVTPALIQADYDMTMKALTGKEASPWETYSEALKSGVAMTLPFTAIGLFGLRHEIQQQKKLVRNFTEEMKPEQMMLIEAFKGQPDKIAESEKFFNDMKEEWTAKGRGDLAPAIDILKQACYWFSFESKGKDAKLPQDFVKDLSAVLLPTGDNVALPRDVMQNIDTLKKSPQERMNMPDKDGVMRPMNLMEYMREVIPDFDKYVVNHIEMASNISMREELEGLSKQWNAKTKNQWSLEGQKGNDARAALAAVSNALGNRNSMSASETLKWARKNPDLAKLLYIHGSIDGVMVKGKDGSVKKVKLTLGEDGVLRREFFSEEKATANTEKAAEATREGKKLEHGDKAGAVNAHDLDRVILLREKAEHFQRESREQGAEDFFNRIERDDALRSKELRDAEGDVQRTKEILQELEDGQLRSEEEKARQEAADKAKEARERLEVNLKLRQDQGATPEELEAQRIEGERLAAEAQQLDYQNRLDTMMALRQESPEYVSERAKREQDVVKATERHNARVEYEKKLQAEQDALRQQANEANHLRMKAIREMPEVLNATQAQQVLAEEFAAAFYDKSRKVAVFFSNADVGTVLHEVMHHIIENKLLPSRYYTHLANKYAAKDSDGVPVWTTEGAQQMANDLLMFIRDNETKGLSPEVQAAFESTAKLLKTAIYRGTDSSYGRLAQRQHLESEIAVGQRLIEVQKRHATLLLPAHVEEPAATKVSEAAPAATTTDAKPKNWAEKLRDTIANAWRKVRNEPVHDEAGRPSEAAGTTADAARARGTDAGGATATGSAERPAGSPAADAAAGSDAGAEHGRVADAAAVAGTGAGEPAGRGTGADASAVIDGRGAAGRGAAGEAGRGGEQVLEAPKAEEYIIPALHGGVTPEEQDRLTERPWLAVPTAKLTPEQSAKIAPEAIYDLKKDGDNLYAKAAAEYTDPQERLSAYLSLVSQRYLAGRNGADVHLFHAIDASQPVTAQAAQEMVQLANSAKRVKWGKLENRAIAPRTEAFDDGVRHGPELDEAILKNTPEAIESYARKALSTHPASSIKNEMVARGVNADAAELAVARALLRDGAAKGESAGAVLEAPRSEAAHDELGKALSRFEPSEFETSLASHLPFAMSEGRLGANVDRPEPLDFMHAYVAGKKADGLPMVLNMEPAEGITSQQYHTEAHRLEKVIMGAMFPGVESAKDLNGAQLYQLRNYMRDVTRRGIAEVSGTPAEKRSEAWRVNQDGPAKEVIEHDAKSKNWKQDRNEAMGGMAAVMAIRNGIVKLSNSVVANNFNLENICRYLDDGRGGSWTKNVWDRVKDATDKFSDALTLHENDVKKFAADGKFLSPSEFNARVKLSTGRVYRMEEIVNLYAESQLGAEGYERRRGIKAWIESNYNKSEDAAKADLKAMFDHINGNAELKARVDAEVKWHNEEMRRLYAMARDIAFKLTGVMPPEMDGVYVPLRRESGEYYGDVASQFELRPGATSGGEAWGSTAGKPSQMQERRGGYGTKVSLNYRENVDAYIKTMANYIHKAEVVSEIRSLLSREDVAKSLTTRFNDATIYDALVKQVKKEMSPSGRTDPVTDGDASLRWLRHGIYNSFLSFNWATTPLTQLSALLDGVSAIGLNRIGLASTSMEFVKIAKWMASHPIDATIGGSRHILDGYDTWATIQRLSPTIVRRTADPFSEGMRGATRGGIIGHIFPRFNAMSEAGTTLMQNTDLMTVVPTWKGAFDMHMDRLVKSHPELNLQVRERMAADEAARIVRDTQNPSSTSELSIMQSGSEWKRMWNMFSSQSFVLFQRNMDKFVFPVMRAMRDGDGFTGKTAEVAKTMLNKDYMFRAATGIALPAFMMSAIGLRRLPNKDELWKSLALYPLMNMPIVGGAIWGSAMLGFDSGHDTYLGDILGAVPRSLKALSQGKVWDNGAAHAGLSTVGVPLYPVKLAERIIDIARGEHPADLRYVAGWEPHKE